jgi:hypothetical protein
LVILGALVVLAALRLRSAFNVGPERRQASTQGQMRLPLRQFDLRIRDAKLLGPTVLKVNQFEELELHVTSDEADHFHLHGYELHLELTADNTATLRFVASHAGRFTFELHRADVELGALEVYPGNSVP